MSSVHIHDGAARRRFLWLFLRSRRVIPVVVSILAITGLVTVWAWQTARDSSAGPNAIDRAIVQRNLMTGLTAVAAAALVLTLRSPWPEMDAAAGTTVRRIQIIVFLVATALLTGAMVVLGSRWDTQGAGAILARGFLGWLGIALIARAFLGDGRAWWIGFAWAGLSIVAGDSWRVHYPPWAWSMQDATSILAWGVALAALVGGLAILTRSTIRPDGS